MTQNLRHSKFRGLVLLVAILLMAVFLKSAIAQDVVGVSEILSSTSSSEIDTYSATELSYAASLYYGAYVEGYLYDNGSQIGAGSAQAQQNAYGYMSKPLTVGDVYEIASYHYLIASFAYSSGGNYYYNNPEYFNPGDGSLDSSGSSFSPGGGPSYVETQYLYLGATAVQVSSAKPSISSISPNAGTIGKSGTINVNGENLLDPFTGNATPAITGSGVTLSAATSSTATQVNLNYSIAQGATTGGQSLTLANRFGTSNAETFTVGYPPAVVTNVSPSVWTAGQQTSVTITGTGFGSAPALSTTAAGVNLTLNSASPDGTTIHATATIAVNAPNESVTITVQPGYAGSGYSCNCPPDQANGTDTATVQPVTPTPQIMFNGGNISGQTNVPIYAGQQIILSVPKPSGYNSMASQQWSFSDNVSGSNAINGGFKNTNQNGPPSAAGGGLELANPDTTQNSQTIYWVNPGATGTVAYTYTLDNGKPASATATFMIQGPTATGANGTFFTTAPGTVVVTPSYDGSSQPGIQFGDPLGNPGMTFTVTATPPANQGMFQWVQLVQNVNEQFLSSPPHTPASYGKGLDNWYPYPTYSTQRNTTSDSPGVMLYFPNLTELGEGAEQFAATMYLMWDPSLNADGTPASGCAATSTWSGRSAVSTASSCSGSIPVPLSSVSWGFSACAINTLADQYSTQTTWILQCPTSAPARPTVQPTSSYPQWQNVDHNTN